MHLPAKRLRTTIVVASLALLVVGGVIAVTLRSGREPRYDGKPLSWWCKQWCAGHTKAEFAIRQIGTNAIPWLLADLDSQPSALKDRVNRYLFNRGCITLFLDRCDRGAAGFYALGDLGKAAIPQLESHLENDSDGRYAIVLANIGPLAVPTIRSAYTNLSATVGANLSRAIGIAASNGRLKGNDLSVFVPLISAQLTSTNIAIVRKASNALERISFAISNPTNPRHPKDYTY